MSDIACQQLMIYSIPLIYIGSMSSTECLPQAVLVLMAWWRGRWVPDQKVRSLIPIADSVEMNIGQSVILTVPLLTLVRGHIG